MKTSDLFSQTFFNDSNDINYWQGVGDYYISTDSNKYNRLCSGCDDALGCLGDTVKICHTVAPSQWTNFNNNIYRIIPWKANKWVFYHTYGPPSTAAIYLDTFYNSSNQLIGDTVFVPLTKIGYYEVDLFEAVDSIGRYYKPRLPESGTSFNYFRPIFVGQYSFASKICAPRASISNIVDDSICRKNYVQYQSTSSRMPTKYEWTFAGGEPSTYSGEYPPPVFYEIPGTYSVTLKVENAAGKDSVTKINFIDVVYCDSCFTLPNIFTPNDDGINDEFKPIVNCPVKSYFLSIFDRWGNEIFITKSIYNSWNGKNKNDKLVSKGAYYAIGTYTLVGQNSKEQKFTGMVYLQ